jgi:hypothetical protein
MKLFKISLNSLNWFSGIEMVLISPRQQALVDLTVIVVELGSEGWAMHGKHCDNKVDNWEPIVKYLFSRGIIL